MEHTENIERVGGSHYCTAGCGKRITYRFAICSDCEKTYGRSATEWPAWLRESWNMTQRWRRTIIRARKHEVRANWSGY